MSGRLEKCFMVVASLYGFLRAVVSRALVVVYTNDMLGPHPWDPRMANVYRWLHERHVPYVNLVHAAPHGHVVRHWWRRTRPVVYLEGLAVLGDGWLRRFLKACRARHLWAIDDYRHWPKVISAAGGVGMRTALFQHGRFTRHQAYLGLAADAPITAPDAYIVWNEYWKSKLISVSPFFAARADRVRVGGKPSGDGGASAPLAPVSRERLSILLIHEPATPAGEVRELVAALCALPGVTVFYKVRGDRSVADQSAFLGALASRITVVGDVVPCSLALGSYSTLLYELVERRMPVGVLKTPFTQAEDLVESGLAASIDVGRGDFLGQLRAASDIPERELERRAQRLRVTVRIGETLERMNS